MAAPTFVSETETVFNNTTTPKTATIAVQAGDVIVVRGTSESNATTLSTPTATGNTFALQQSVVVSNYTTAYIWTAVAAATAGSLVVSVAKAAGTGFWGFSVEVWRSATVGTSAKTNVLSGAPSLAVTTTAANSALSILNSDWSAQDGTTRTWRTVNGSAATEEHYFRDAARYTTYAGRHDDAGAIGSKTVGLSAPGSQKYSIIVLEIKGPSGISADVDFDITAGLTAETVETLLAQTSSTVTADRAANAITTKLVDGETEATATLTAAATVTRQAAADSPWTVTLTTEASVASAGISADADLTVTTTLIAAADVTKKADSSSPWTSGLTADATVTKLAGGSTVITAALTAVSIRTTLVQTDRAITAGLTANAIRLQAAGASSPFTATLIAAASRRVSATATLVIGVGLTADAIVEGTIALYVGPWEVSNLRAGSQQVSRVYVGSSLIRDFGG